MAEELTIIAHYDLPGNYRLIRVMAAELSREIMAGAAIYLPGEIKIHYLRHSEAEHKIDFLFYLTPENQYLLTNVKLLDYHYFIGQIKPKIFKDNLTLHASNKMNLPEGLAFALDKKIAKNIDLFLFEIGEQAPFKLQPSKFYLPYMPAGVIANFTLLEEKNVTARVCSIENLPGCFDGELSQLIEKIGN